MTTGSTKRDDILRAALELFAERGFHGTSVPDLAKAAGVGAGTIYRHFENKEALVNTLYQQWKNTLLTECYGNLPMDVPWRQRFSALWRGLFRFNTEHPNVIDFLDLHHHSDYLDETSRALEQQSATVLFALVAMAQAEQIFVDFPRPALVALVYSAFLGLVRAESEGYVVLDEPLIAAAEDRVWAMVRR